MTIASMCRGSIVVPQIPTHTVGAASSDSIAQVDGSPLDCNAQTMSASTAFRYDARGEKRLWTLFFAADPVLTPDTRVKLTQVANRPMSPAKPMRVLAGYAEDDPMGRLGGLYIVDCEEITTRFET